MGSGQPMKELVLAEIRRVTTDDGKTRSSRRFIQATGLLGKWWAGRYWARWSDAVRGAGLTPLERVSQFYMQL